MPVRLPLVLDVRRIRTDFDGIKAELARRHDDAALRDLDELVVLDARQRELTTDREAIRAKVKTLSNDVRSLRQAGDDEGAEEKQRESRALGDEAQKLDDEHESLTHQVRMLLLRIPNVPAAEAPDGAGPEDNVVTKVVGYDGDAYGPHQRVPHWEVGVELGLLDAERAVKLSGSMFVMYRRDGARLIRALTSLALDRHTSGDGAYDEIRPPTLVKTDTMISTGHLPKFVDEAYSIERDELWAIPTAEVPLTSMHRDEILDERDLPRRYCAYTPCFRREAGSAGADTRGTLRTHEFDKVELFAYATEATALAVHADIVARAEALLTDLGLAYRVLDLCAGDLGFSSRRTFDLEVYSPGCDKWLEVSSVSWYGDYQSRRANVRYRPTEGKGTEFTHTINGSALAWSRIWAALIETHRQPDATVALPEVLRPYMRGASHIG
jgi:seryl-tRNA synthetase